MQIKIRCATINDVDAIAEIIKIAFDDDVDKERIKHLLLLSHNYTYVAVQAKTVVGFVDSFLTVSQQNQIRWELDLLAVHPNARGQGIGKKLIETSIDQAKQLGVCCLRALISSENQVMQQVCKRMNLTQSQNECGLYIKSPQHVLHPLIETPNAHLIRVETFTYSGIWLEGDITEPVVDNAHLIAKQNQCDIIGAVVNKTNTQIVDVLLKNEFVHVADYRWWMLNLRND